VQFFRPFPGSDLTMKLAIIGCGGHGRVILDILRQSRHQVLYFLDDDPARLGERVHGVIVEGPSDVLRDLPKVRKPKGVVVAVGDNHKRANIFARVREWGFKTPNILHPRAIIATHVGLEEGDVVMAGAVVNPGARLGFNVCINTGAKVDHDCLLGNHCHIFPGAILTGGVEVGEYSCVGSGAVVNPYLKIGRDAFVGSGAAVIRNVPEGVVVAGVPAEIIKRTDDVRK
jgi:sugar O-acyltransferase (sialic acid O-acetyltransferase NeuD family)